MSRAALLLLRLRTRLLQKCTQHSPTSLNSGYIHSSTLQYTRQLHTTPSVFVTGSQRKQFAEELQQKLKKDELQGSGRGRLDFDKVVVETGGGRGRRGREYQDRGRDHSQLKGQAEVKQSCRAETSTEPDVAVSELDPGLSESDFDGNKFETEVVSDTTEQASEVCLEGGPESVPVNIIGDLDSLFSDVTKPEPVVSEQEGVVETLGSEVDYNIYYNPVEGDRYVMPERALGLRDLDCSIPLHHVVQFIRDYKCFDTEVIQARPGMYVEHVIITSVHNTKHLKDTSRAFFKMCRDDYDMSMANNEKSSSGHSWKAYDIGHSLVHFFLPSHRAKFNLESFWLGQDTEVEDIEMEEERYTSDLLEGLFPDEDFSKLGRPFELIFDNKEKGNKRS
ncbi:hypothetical protein ACHWQZ_G011011 [Mnemiopsis leidyi]